MLSSHHPKPKKVVFAVAFSATKLSVDSTVPDTALYPGAVALAALLARHYSGILAMLDPAKSPRETQESFSTEGTCILIFAIA